MLKFRVFLIGNIFFASQVLGASCCGGGHFANPLVHNSGIRLGVSYLVQDIVIDSVDSSGVWRTQDQSTQVSTAQYEVSASLNEFWFISIGAQKIEKSQGSRHYSGYGDSRFQLGFNLASYLESDKWPNMQLDQIKLIATATGANSAPRESSTEGGLDSFGSGFNSLGVGVQLGMNQNLWDYFSAIFFRQYNQRSLQVNQENSQWTPSTGGQFYFGAGYKLGKSRFWGLLSFVEEGDVEFKTDSFSSIRPTERYGLVQIAWSQVWQEKWSTTISVLDQTLVGSPINTSLSRGLQMGLDYNF